MKSRRTKALQRDATASSTRLWSLCYRRAWQKVSVYLAGAPERHAVIRHPQSREVGFGKEFNPG